MQRQKDLILVTAWERWGEDAQLRMVIEECAELIQAISKLSRVAKQGHDARANLVEELADVAILVEGCQLNMPSVDWKQERINRLKKVANLLNIEDQIRALK